MYFNKKEQFFLLVGLLISGLFLALYNAREIPEKLIDRSLPVYSMIVLDLDYDQKVHPISKEDNRVWWDYDNDDFRERGQWIEPSDGFLAIDRNENSRIDGIRELVGGYGDNAFLALSDYDSNSDGVVDKRDSYWSLLKIWVDKNKNGYSERNEIKPIALTAIREISVESIAEDDELIKYVAPYYTYEGMVRQTANAASITLTYDDFNSIYSGSYDLNIEAIATNFFARGYGVIPDLHIAMSIDHGDPDSLLAKVQEFKSTRTRWLFDPSYRTEDQIKDILFRWAGLQNIGVGSRGPNVDARELEFVEKALGQRFRYNDEQGRESSNPLFYNSLPYKESFEKFFHHYFAIFMTQTEAANIFRGENISYDFKRDKVRGVQGIDVFKISIHAQRHAKRKGSIEEHYESNLIFWTRIARMIDVVIGYENLKAHERLSLDKLLESYNLAWEKLELYFVVPHFSLFRGSTYASRELGMTANDSNTVTGLFKKSRELSDESQVVISDIVTEFLKECCNNINQTKFQLEKEGFTVKIETHRIRDDDHFLRGDRVNFLHARKRIENPYTKFFTKKYLIYDLQILVKDGVIDWVNAHSQEKFVYSENDEKTNDYPPWDKSAKITP